MLILLLVVAADAAVKGTSSLRSQYCPIRWVEQVSCNHYHAKQIHAPTTVRYTYVIITTRMNRKLVKQIGL